MDKQDWKFIIVFVMLMGSAVLQLQAQSYKQFHKLFTENDFEKAKEKIEKGREKKPNNPTLLYAYSVYFSSQKNNGYQLDSARKYAIASIDSYQAQPLKEIEKLEKSGLDSMAFHAQKAYVDSLAFAFALKEHTEKSYLNFLARFPLSEFEGQAISKRDSLAFDFASEEDTYQEYQNFFEKYPDAVQAKEAHKRYQVLIYEHKTMQGNVESYEKFIKEHPDSPFRKEAEEKLYFLFTTDNNPQTLKEFLRRHPKNTKAGEAWYRLWFLTDDKASFLRLYPNFPHKKWAEKYLAVNDKTLYLYLQNNEYGFIDNEGDLVLRPVYKDVSEDYFCHYTNSDYFIVIDSSHAGAIDKTGKTIAHFLYDDIEAFGRQALVVESEGRYGLVHRGGFEIIGCEYDGLAFLDDVFIKAQHHGKWGMITYNDRKALNFKFEDVIQLFPKTYLLKKRGVFSPVKQDQLLSMFESEDRTMPSLRFDWSTYRVEHNMAIVNKRGKFCGYDSALNMVFSPKYDSLVSFDQGWYAFLNDSTCDILDLTGQPRFRFIFNGLEIVGSKFIRRFQGKWGAYNYVGDTLAEPIYDSIYVYGDKGLVLVQEGKSSFEFASSKAKVDISPYSRIEPIMGNVKGDSTEKKEAFIILYEGNNAAYIQDTTGKPIIRRRFNEIKKVSESLIRVKVGRKFGLYGFDGKSVLPITYDGITAINDSTFALFKSKKFGLYLYDKGTIRPIYNAVIKPYGFSDTLFIAKTDKLGLIDAGGKKVTDFRFDKIEFWSEQAMLVKTDGKWRLYDIARKSFLNETFDALENLVDNEGKRTIITYRSSGMGLLDNQYGRIVPEEYSEIFNIGSDEEPLYYVEKQVAQAGLYVILYIDHTGKVLRKEVIKEESRDKLVCSDE